MSGSVLIVHGTGVRSAAFKVSFDAAVTTARAAGVVASFHQCLWGDPLGIEFAGLSLPDPPEEAERRKMDAEDETWAWRFDNPLLELEQMTIAAERDSRAGAFGPQVWRGEFKRIHAYKPTQDLLALLAREQLGAYWPAAWGELLAHPVVVSAFEQSGVAGELPECKQALARAAVATLNNVAVSSARSGPSASLRAKLCSRLSEDWGQVYGLGTKLADLTARAMTAGVRRRRNPLNFAIASAIGDILLYQLHGDRIRAFIRSKIEDLTPPVTIVAHSLGGIACMDLLAMAGPPEVEHLVTVGSQTPYFYEIGALTALAPPEQPPASFPRWLNLYDRNDFLSFVGEQLFLDRVEDHETRSGQPFPASHSSYLTSEDAWRTIAAFCRW